MARPRQVDLSALALRLQTAGPLTAQALAAAASVDRSNISRALAALGDQVVALGVTRGTRYALRRDVRGAGARFPVYRLDADGRAQSWAEVTALHPRDWRLSWVSEAQTPAWAALIHDHAGLCEGFPFFLGDVRPQGYLGRAVARRLPSVLGLPADPRDWSDDDTLIYLQAEGDDLPGNLVIGDGAMRRVATSQLSSPVFIEKSFRAERFVELASLAVSGGAAGSSVDGEQPKFTAVLADDGTFSAAAAHRHVIVKFTDLLDTPTGRRWADLLAAEAHAHAVLHARGEAYAEARVLDAGGRRFHELPRFDRVGAHGRVGVVSLRSLYDALAEARDATTWPLAARELRRLGVIDDVAERSIRLRHTFGGLIGNTDMHFGNLAFFLGDTLPLRLAPAYDMLPMLWAPVAGQAMPAPTFSPPVPLPGEMPDWSEAAAWAAEFWQRVATDTRISSDFVAHARLALAHLERMRACFVGRIT
jgi:hypothetical protein